MISSDMPEVLAIEFENFEFPWLEEDFIRTLLQKNCIGMVAEHDGRVVGFMIYDLHKTRIHLLDFAVATEYQLHGIGRAMANKLICKLSSARRTSIVCEVRENNVDAQVFFRTMGFRATRVLKDFYEDSPEDAYQFVRRHSERKSEGNRINQMMVGDC
jgi:ribosomal-protein-alanine N-acetyltransferase